MIFSRDGFHEWKCIFIHIPKTGGMSVSECLFGSQVGHHTASEFKSWGNEYFRFTFVRNPLDRLFSAYNWYLDPNRNDADTATANTYIRPHGDFSNFILKGLEDVMHLEHFRPQQYWLDDPVHFIGRYEMLDDGVRYVQRVLGMPEKILPRVNMGPNEDLKCSTKALQRIKDIYSEGFRRFRYD